MYAKRLPIWSTIAWTLTCHWVSRATTTTAIWCAWKRCVRAYVSWNSVCSKCPHVRDDQHDRWGKRSLSERVVGRYGSAVLAGKPGDNPTAARTLSNAACCAAAGAAPGDAGVSLYR